MCRLASELTVAYFGEIGCGALPKKILGRK